MARLSKQKIKMHEQAEDLLHSDKKLKQSQIDFVYEHWNPNYNQQVSKTGAFFTPMKVASELMAMTINTEGRLLDLCAGIGSLSYMALCHNYWNWYGISEIVALEINPEFIRVGKRLLPDVTWVEGSMFDLHLLHSLGKFDSVYSNPPFGNVPSKNGTDWLKFQGVAHLSAVEVAMHMCTRGAGFILPQQDLPWSYSGNKRYGTNEYGTDQWRKFHRTWPNIDVDCVAVDLSFYEWKEAPMCEVASITTMDDLALPPLPEYAQASLF